MSANSPISVQGDLELLRVRFYEISVKYKEAGTDRRRKKAKLPAKASVPVDVEVGIKSESSEVGFRVSIEYSDDDVSARIDCAAFFRRVNSDVDYASGDGASMLIAEAVPIVVPYIREALADSTRRVTGKPITLGLVKIDSIAFHEDVN